MPGTARPGSARHSSARLGSARQWLASRRPDLSPKGSLGPPRPKTPHFCMRGACAVHARGRPYKFGKLGSGGGGWGGRARVVGRGVVVVQTVLCELARHGPSTIADRPLPLRSLHPATAAGTCAHCHPRSTSLRYDMLKVYNCRHFYATACGKCTTVVTFTLRHAKSVQLSSLLRYGMRKVYNCRHFYVMTC